MYVTGRNGLAPESRKRKAITLNSNNLLKKVFEVSR